MNILQKEYLLIAAAVIFFGVLFFVQDVLAVPCLGAGERCIQLTDAGCEGDEPIGTCGLNGEMTCCKANNLPSPPPLLPNWPKLQGRLRFINRGSEWHMYWRMVLCAETPI